MLLPKKIPIILSLGSVLFPHKPIELTIDIATYKTHYRLIKEGEIIGITALINSNHQFYSIAERIGIAGKIKNLAYDNNECKFFFEPISRIEIITLPNSPQNIIGEVKYHFYNRKEDCKQEIAILLGLIGKCQKIASAEKLKKARNLMRCYPLPDFIDALTDAFIENPRIRQLILSARTGQERLIILNSQLERFITLKNQEKKTIPVENPLPAEIIDLITKEEERMKAVQKGSAEHGISEKYLNWLKKVPWLITTPDNSDLQKAKKILEESHYGMTETKKQIISFLTTRMVNSKKKGRTLLLLGAPGVGKTSICKAIAETMERKYLRLSVAGLKDEAVLKGHRRTYVASSPGKIITLLTQATCKNPVFVLDEIEKASKSPVENASGPLLQLLDPEQNSTFEDHFLDTPFDASQIMFIATANTLEGIDRALLDRMEIIKVDSYCFWEKMKIAKKHLVPKILAEYNNKFKIKIPSEIIEKIIKYYTCEAGVRDLQRKLDTVITYIINRKVLEGKETENINLFEIIGPPEYNLKGKKELEIGEAMGLAWTSVGGMSLPFQVIETFKPGIIEMTGRLGKTLEESIKLSHNLAANIFFQDEKDAKFFFSKYGLHVHSPGGGKDGPSAGITITMAILSLLKKEKIAPGIAMTGEVDSKNRVLKIGGLKEKIIAAHRIGIKKVLIPKENEICIPYENIPEEVLAEIEIIGIKTIEEAIEHCFNREKPKQLPQPVMRELTC